MALFEPFTLVEESASLKLFDTFRDLNSAKVADPDIQYQAVLREAYPYHIATAIPTSNCNLLAFAQAGHAVAKLDLESDSTASWRGWLPSLRAGQPGQLGESYFFAKYCYEWQSESFILYKIRAIQYVLAARQANETFSNRSVLADALITAAGTWQSSDTEFVWVFDNNIWTRSKELFNQVKKAEWSNVILDESMKKTLTDISTKFFDSEDIYEDLGVPWKRGLIFYGPAGNGKTISIKALMHTLLKRQVPVPTLYVKAAPMTYSIGAVFRLARQVAPCLLVFEDIDTVVTNNTRSYFFNEVDGLASNDGILMVASTNHLDRLDPGIINRPSRFDRKYLFPLPSEHERTLYCEFWRHKLQQKNQRRSVEFPKELCPAIASITEDFSFAYMQEAFVASLLAIAREEVEEDVDFETSRRDHLDDYKLWVIIKEQVRLLREDMESQTNHAINRSLASDFGHRLDISNEPVMDHSEDILALGSSAEMELPQRKYQIINSKAYAWQ